MEKNSKILQEKDTNSLLGDLEAAGLGAAVGGPIGAMAGLGARKLYNWSRGAYQKWKKNKKTNNKNNKSDEEKNSQTPIDLATKIKNAQDSIRNAGMFEPEVYKAHQFYKTTIYDKEHPEENNFVYISQKRNGKEAYNYFIEYWINKYKEKYKHPTAKGIESFTKLLQARFLKELNEPCYISVPQNFIIDSFDITVMAKNSDIMDHEKCIYYDRPTFDSNYAFDVHMYQNKNEDVEDDVDEYKTSLISFNLFDTDYVCACEPGIDVDLSTISGSVILSLGQELMNDDDDKLYKFSKIVERMVDTEQKRVNVYCVATPLLIKDARTAHDLEYNACLLDGLNLYESEEEFKDNYLEEYQKLINNQMGL